MVTFFTDADITSTGETVEPTVTLATEFSLPAGTINRMRAWFPALAGATPSAKILKSSDGSALMASRAFDTTTVDTWNWATPASGISWAGGNVKVCQVVTRYVFRGSYLPITRGSITAVQSRFLSGDTDPTNTTATWFCIDIDFTAASTPIIGNLGIPSETDSGLTVSKRKIFLLGIPSTTDSGLAYGRRKIRTLGITGETDSALTIARKKIRTLGIASETDAGLAITRRHAKALGLPSETDTGLTVGKRKARTTGIASETDAPLALTQRKLRGLGIPVESDSALVFGHPLGTTLGIPAETDSAFILRRRKTRTLGIPSDVSSALSLTYDAHIPSRIPTHIVDIKPKQFKVDIGPQEFSVRNQPRSYEVEME